MRGVLEFFDVLLHPGCWLQNHPFSREWDDELTWLLDNGYRFDNVTNYRAEIGGYDVWIENHPYASFTLDGMRPRRATVLRAGRIFAAYRRAAWLERNHLPNFQRPVPAPPEP